MFGFLKKRENSLKKIVFLLEQVFLEANEAFLLKEIRDDVFAKIQLGFNGSFNIFFTEKAALYEKQIPKMNTTFRNIKVQDKKDSYSDLEITVIDNLVAGLKFSNSNFDFYNISLINIGSMQKINKCIEDEYIIKKLTIFGFDMLNIPFCEIYEVKLKDKEYLHLRDVFDGDFIGLCNNELYWLRHEENQELLIPKELHDFFRKKLFQESDDEIHKKLINLL